MTLTATRLRFLLGIAVGVALGLIYGWLLRPVEFVDTSPSSLRVDYRTDYALMVAEAFEAEPDPEEARRRLAALGPQAPTDIVSDALHFAESQGFAEPDIQRLQDLEESLQRRQASPEIRSP